MRVIKQNFWFSFFCLLILIGLLGLGTWQVKRLHWKNNLIEIVTKNMALPPMALSEFCQNNPECPPVKLPENEFRMVTVEGTYIHDLEIHLGAKYNGRELGYHIVTPLLTKGDNVVMINRGWVPSAEKDPTKRPETIIKEPVTITGYIRTNFKKPMWFLPQNKPEENLWFWPDINEFKDYLQKQGEIPGEKIMNIVIQQTVKYENLELPIPLESRLEIRNDHLEYAITWYALALIVAVMYLIYIRKKLS